MSALRIEILDGPSSTQLADRLRAKDDDGLVTVEVVDEPGRAAFVIAVADHAEAANGVADAVLDASAPLAEQLDLLWDNRIDCFAQLLTGQAQPRSPRAVLYDHDPSYGVAALRLLTRLRSALAEDGLDDGSWTYDHIGSTAVPLLRAKRFVDLQIAVDPVPANGSEVDAVLRTLGFIATHGARPDSPGVYVDQIKDPTLAPEADYRKRLYVRPDPVHPAILHVRKLGAPWASYTVRFRDWLRTDPAGRRAYQAAKEQAALARADDPDYDNYTRDKTAFFERIQHDYEQPSRNDD